MITGLGEGTGGWTARRFAKAGYRVAMLARTEERLRKFEKELPGSKGYVCDVSDLKHLEVICKKIKNEMFYAEKGNGAYLNNTRIRVSNQKKISDSLVVTGGPKGASKIKDKIFSEYINVSNNVANVRKFGSAALDIAYVACGRFDGYWQRELNYWDIAAGIIILKEAGGFVDFFEEEKNFPLKKNILATNSFVHEELRELINK